jgi:hypothetical protein
MMDGTHLYVVILQIFWRGYKRALTIAVETKLTFVSAITNRWLCSTESLGGGNGLIT